MGTLAPSLSRVTAIEKALHKTDSAASRDNSKGSFIADDLDRQVYCVLGVPVDVIDLPEMLHAIDGAVASSKRLSIATPNINFLINSQTNLEFQESLLASDLCPVDGMPLVWIAKLLGIPLHGRTAGSDIFAALRARPSDHLIRLFLFGATETVAKAAEESINRAERGLLCVGRVAPGFGEVDEISDNRFFQQIRESKADFLVAALGARKGQLWLHRNREAIHSPVRAHLGAVINFEAGTIRRAPELLRRVGLEWAWRIKEEPVLWKRYLYDGSVLLRLLISRVLPLMVAERRFRANQTNDLIMTKSQRQATTVIHLSGHALAPQADRAATLFRSVLDTECPIILDCNKLLYIDLRFYGLLAMLRKQVLVMGQTLTFEGVSPQLRRQFRRNGVESVFLADGKQ